MNNGDAASTDVQIWTLIVAGLAVLASLIGTWLVRRTGKGQVAAAKQAAAASERSSQAAEKSAQAAQDAVGVNRETATGVAERAKADALAKRYQDAAEQLGHEKAPVRLAGAYAMASLADDWPERQQPCVDVLCAYLRMPYDENKVDEEQVRSSIIKLISDHLHAGGSRERRAGHAGAWSRLTLNLDGATMGDGRFTKPVFWTEAEFNNASFGDFNFSSPTFHSDLNLFRARINGSVEIIEPTFETYLFASGLHVGPKGYFGINLGMAGRAITVDFEDLTIEGKLQILIRKLARPEELSLNRLQAAAGSLIIIEYKDGGDKDDTETMEWFQANDWKVEADAKIWVPKGVDLTGIEADESAYVKHGPFGT
jgi:hypothetical protein